MPHCIKVFICNSKAEMCRLLLKHYDRPKEVIPALAMMVERTGYIIPYHLEPKRLPSVPHG